LSLSSLQKVIPVEVADIIKDNSWFFHYLVIELSYWTGM
jgi:hypothetical protein